MFCQNCGKEIPDGSAFCEHCGAPAAVREEVTELASDIPFQPEDEQYKHVKTQKSSGRPRWLLPVLFVCLAAISIAGGMFVASIAGGDDEGDGPDPAPTEVTEETSGSEDGGEKEEGSDALAEPGSPQARVYAARGVGGGEGNEFYSFDLAIEQGAVCVEQDVIMSSQGTLYVTRDRAYNDEPDSASEGAGFPKLDEVFDYYGNSIIYVVEIKNEKTEAAEELIRLIHDHGLEDNVIIQSFYPRILSRVKEEFPDMTSIILHDDGDMNRVSFEEALGLDCADMVAVSVDEGMMTGANCRRAHDAGKGFAAWNLNEEYQIREGIDMGLDAYFTQYPARALKLEENNR